MATRIANGPLKGNVPQMETLTSLWILTRSPPPSSADGSSSVQAKASGQPGTCLHTVPLPPAPGPSPAWAPCISLGHTSVPVFSPRISPVRTVPGLSASPPHVKLRLSLSSADLCALGLPGAQGASSLRLSPEEEAPALRPG